MQPRRFGYVFQIDPDRAGSAAQAAAVRDALSPAWGTLFNAFLYNLARRYKELGRWWVSIEIKPFPPEDHNLALAGTVSIALSDRLAVSAIRDVIRHEVFHVYDNNDYLTWDQRTWFMRQLGDDLDWNHHRETFADAGRDWANSDGAIWSALTPILTGSGT